MADYKLNYDTESGGPFTEGELLTFTGGETAELVMLYDNGLDGEMYISLISGSVPIDSDTITGGSSGATAAVDGTPFLSRFPVNIRDDTSYDNATGNIRWTGPNLGTTHSCKYDAELNGPFTLGETLTFGNGSTAELIQLTDNGTDGELFFRMIDVALPSDNDTITGSASPATTAAVDGAVHVRAYKPNDLHYWYLDKGDDQTFTGNDEQDRTQPRISERIGVTDVNFLGNANIDAAMAYHMYGGSVSQNTGDDEFNAAAIQIVDPNGTTEPVIIQNNALLSATTTEYWKNAYMPDAANKINMLIQVKSGGTVTDRRVVRFRSLERFDSFFTAPDATLSGGITPVSLVTADDGNDSTADATVATWTDAVFAYGYDTVDHVNGNGAQPYWAVGDLGTRTKAQFHERFKWTQRRGTSETIFGLNAQLVVGNDLTIPYDTEVSGPFTEGETLTFSGNSSGTALLLALDDQGVSGTLYCQRLTGDVPIDGAVITGSASPNTTAAINGTPTTEVILNNLFGTFTGSDFNPANKGMTLEAADATNGDLFFDLLGAQQQPPNNQSGAVNSAVGNTITAFPYDGSSTDAVGDPLPEFDRLTLDTALTGASEVTVSCNETIPTWVPQQCPLRITLNSGATLLVTSTSYTGSDFTIPATNFTGDNASISNGVMPAPIDKVATSTLESFTGIYTANQNSAGTGDQEFVIKVTRGSDATPKQPNIGTTTFTSGGFSVNVSLQDD